MSKGGGGPSVRGGQEVSENRNYLFAMLVAQHLFAANSKTDINLCKLV